MITPRVIQQICRHPRWSLPVFGARWCFVCGVVGKFFKETR